MTGGAAALRLLALAALVCLAACAQGGPRLGLGIGVGPGGVSVSPRVAAGVGPVTLGAGPGGVSAGVSLSSGG